MSQEVEEEALPPVLTTSVHDVRYFAALLRGVNFVNRATVTVTERGLTVTVEEARSLIGTAFIFAGVFDEYAYHPEPPPAPLPPRAQPQRGKGKSKAKEKAKAKNQKKQNTSSPRTQSPSDSETESESEEDDKVKDRDWEDDDEARDRDREKEREDDQQNNAAFEVPLNTLLECLNIFGTAGPSSANVGASSSGSGGGGGGGGGRGGGGGGGGGGRPGRGWHRRANDDDAGSEAEDGAGRGIEAYFGAGGSEKRTSMRLSYPGAGYPLTLIIAEDASGPTTTCEITTFDSETQLELPFDDSKTILKIILKSSWLRDALSELDPSCEKLTFIGNQPTAPEEPASGSGSSRDAGTRNQRQRQRAPPARPMLRIEATGAFGSTEMDYPNDRDVLETFECLRNVSFSYRFGHVSRTMRALQSSTKTSLRIDEDGLLSVQFLMPSPKPRAAGGGSIEAFIEFRCLPLDDDF